jgi:hypothetical protein
MMKGASEFHFYKTACDVKYQTQIETLMQKWVEHGD